MNKHLDRRDFAKRASATVGGLVTGALLRGSPSAAADRNASDKRLLLLGLNAMARAHELDYFADGHRGASIVSAHLLCVENNFDERAASRIAELIDVNWTSTPLCNAFPDAKPDPSRIGEIGLALAEGGEVLRQVGHNAIFAMLAIK